MTYRPQQPHFLSSDESSVFEESTLEEELQGVQYEDVYIGAEEEYKLKGLKKDIDIINERVVKKDIFVDKNYRIDYKNELNKEQLLAVSIIDKPLLVIAGAGTGKTRVITYKVAYLIENNVSAHNILLLTFTRKAAKEMIDRVHNLLQVSAEQSRVFGGTFHSFAARILRIYGDLIGLPPFTILDVEDVKNLIDLVKKEKGFYKKGDKPFPKNGIVQTIMSRADNLGVSVKEIIETSFEDQVPAQYKEDVEQLIQEVQKYKKEHNMLDYDDLISVLCYYLRHNQVFLQKIRSRFSYVLVDEYQDTNTKQREIVELIVGDRSTVTVVGDDSQSIYGFRGANYENILRFPESFPECVSVKIEENYRSTQEILNFTNQVIDKNQLVFQKHLRSTQHRYKPVVHQTVDQIQESQYIVEQLKNIHQEQGLRYTDFAVLVRSSWHSIFIQTELMKNNIPFIVVGGMKFQEKRHIKDVIAFLKVVVNPFDTIAWHRIMHLIEGIGNVKATDIVASILANNGDISFSGYYKQKYYSDLLKYEALYREIHEKVLNPKQSLEKVLGVYIPLLENIEPDYQQRLIDLDILVTLSSEYRSMDSFLTNFSLDPPNTSQNDVAILDNKYKDVVIVSTIHSAKGLEWHTVFIPHLVEGAFPSARALYSLRDIEEERRVFYVATTRAKQMLFLTLPAYISIRGNEFTKPSRFIAELDSEVFDIDKKV